MKGDYLEADETWDNDTKAEAAEAMAGWTGLPEHLSDDEEKESRLCGNPTLARVLLGLAIAATAFCGMICYAWMEAHP